MRTNDYIILAFIALLLCTLVLLYSIPKMSKFFNDEEFKFFKSSEVEGIRFIMSNLSLVVLSVFFIFALTTGLVLVFLGRENPGQLEVYEVISFTFFFCLLLPLFIFLVLTLRKTKRLAKQGHKLAGYFNPQVNPRANLFGAQFTFFTAMLFSWLLIIATIVNEYDDTSGRNIPLLLFMLTPYIGLFVFPFFLERTLSFIMIKTLGEDLNIDYGYPIWVAEEQGISIQEFVQRKFTKKQLKTLGKEIAKRDENFESVVK